MKYLILLLTITSCALFDTSKEVKSPLNHLNGENYKSHENVVWLGPIPTNLTRKNRVSKISGTLLIKNNILFTPLSHKKITLTNLKTKEQRETTSQNSGHFHFTDYLNNGDYRLQIQSKKYDGHLNFKISSYETKNLKFIVSEKRTQN